MCDLPPELLFEIALNYLQVFDIYKLSLTCKPFYSSLFGNEKLFILLSKRDHSIDFQQSSLKESKQIYYLSNKIQKLKIIYESNYSYCLFGLSDECARGKTTLTELEFMLTSPLFNYQLKKNNSTHCEDFKVYIIMNCLLYFKNSPLYIESLERIFTYVCSGDTISDEKSKLLNAVVYYLYRQVKDRHIINQQLLSLTFRVKLNNMLGAVLLEALVDEVEREGIQDHHFDIAVTLFKWHENRISFIIIECFYEKKNQEFMEFVSEMLEHVHEQFEKALIRNISLVNEEIFEDLIHIPYRFGSRFLKKNLCKRIITNSTDFYSKELKETAFKYFIKYEKSWEIDIIYSTYLNLKEDILTVAGYEFFEKHKLHFHEIFFEEWMNAIEKYEILTLLSRIDHERIVDKLLHSDPSLNFLRYSPTFEKYFLKTANSVLSIFRKHSNSERIKDKLIDHLQQASKYETSKLDYIFLIQWVKDNW